MSQRSGTVAAALAFTLAALAPLGASAQRLDPPGSDRAGKAARVDAPPLDPAPAPSARPLAGQDPLNPVPPSTTLGRRPAAPLPPVINTHQIDRFDAIKKVQTAVDADPKALDDWIILGELSHEVAMDVPAEMAEKYFVLSRDAFAKALTLDPNNAGLKAAVQFARDQASQVEAFETARDAATDTFLAARRRDLTAMRHTPSVRVVSSMPPLPARELPRPVPPTRVNAAGTVAENAPVIIPASEGVASTDSANYGTRSDYSAAAAASPLVNPSPVTYLPFTTTAGVPYTYGQYSSTYFPSGVYSNSALPPVTIQRYGLAPARAMPNPLERRILNNAGAVSPR